MSSPWQRRRILIWGKTRPELSQTYKEIVCTGGVFEDTRKLVRLYPIPLRYMDDQSIFKKYQWIEAHVQRPTNDPRPESYRIREDGIVVLETIPPRSGNWDERARWIMNPENIYQSVEILQDRQEQNRTSLGLVKPKSALNFRAVRYAKAERNAFWDRYRSALAQMDLPLDAETGREIKPLTPPDYRFKVDFTCNDDRCSGHQFNILDWEVDALYFRLKQQGKSPDWAAELTIRKLRSNCADDKDVYFFLGNISNHPHVFTIVGLWYPRKKPEDPNLPLFDEWPPK